jgi:hypothetical protein
LDFRIVVECTAHQYVNCLDSSLAQRPFIFSHSSLRVFNHIIEGPVHPHPPLPTPPSKTSDHHITSYHKSFVLSSLPLIHSPSAAPSLALSLILNSFGLIDNPDCTALHPIASKIGASVISLAGTISKAQIRRRNMVYNSRFESCQPTHILLPAPKA